MEPDTGALDVNTEAKRILAVSISKLYASRGQRGGLRLHRSLLLSLVMRSARDIYHSACARAAAEEQPMDTAKQAEEPQPQAAEPEEPPSPTPQSHDDGDGDWETCEAEETAEDKENQSPTRESRKRRGKVSAAPDFLPSKRARLEPGEERHAVPLAGCRAGCESLAALSLNRAIPAC